MQKIDVRIPFESGGKLGVDCNRIMKETVHDWVLFLDHDVFLCNPHWYLLCQKAIDSKPKAGMFSCWTNNLGRTMQRNDEAPKGNNLSDHIDFSRLIFDKHLHGVTQIDKCSGFFMLINKSAWAQAGGFPGVGFFKEDWDFSKRLTQAGYKIYRIDGLYIYHQRDREIGSWIDTEKTSKDYRDERVKK